MTSFQNVSDSEWLRLLLANDEKAILHFFYKKYWRTFEYHLYRIFSYRVDVQEFVHEFFLYLRENDWRRMCSFNPEVSCLNTWVSVVSLRFFLYFKKTKIDSNGLMTINGQWNENIMQYKQECREQVTMDVTKAIACLKNDTERDVARELLIEGLDIKEVAELHHLSVDYAYTVKSRAIARLRTILKDYRS